MEKKHQNVIVSTRMQNLKQKQEKKKKETTTTGPTQAQETRKAKTRRIERLLYMGQ